MSGQAKRIKLAYIDTFSAIGTFCCVGKVGPKTAYDGVFANAAAFDKKVGLLYLHSGAVSVYAGIHERAESLLKTLHAAGIKKLVFRDAKEFAHQWKTGRYDMHDFAPRLFPEKK
jgi:hypothetical protein